MKARVIATGEIVEVRLCGEWTNMHGDILLYRTNDGVEYSSHDLSFKIDDERGEPQDYWTRLEHQYAGMAMQGLMTILPNIGGLEGRTPKDEIVDIATETTHALVEKYKKEEMK